MQQKVQFVATVIHNPQLLIFDEPFSGFDPVNAELLKKEILDLRNQGHTIIFSTHNMASVEEICDNIALIDKSKVVLSGNVLEVRNRYKTDNIVLTYRKQSEELKPIPEMFDILSVEDQESGITSVRMHKHRNVTNSALLTSLAEQVEILSFAEEIPSMNEIFINTVAGINKEEESCKPKQSAYKAAYEQAKAKETTAPVETVTQPASEEATPVSKPRTSNVSTRAERINAAEGEDASMAEYIDER